MLNKLWSIIQAYHFSLKIISETLKDTSRLVETRLKNLKHEVIKSSSADSTPINQLNSTQNSQETAVPGPKKVLAI